MTTAAPHEDKLGRDGLNVNNAISCEWYEHATLHPSPAWAFKPNTLHQLVFAMTVLVRLTVLEQSLVAD